MYSSLGEVRLMRSLEMSTSPGLSIHLGYGIACAYQAESDSHGEEMFVIHAGYGDLPL